MTLYSLTIMQMQREKQIYQNLNKVNKERHTLAIHKKNYNLEITTWKNSLFEYLCSQLDYMKSNFQLYNLMRFLQFFFKFIRSNQNSALFKVKSQIQEWL